MRINLSFRARPLFECLVVDTHCLLYESGIIMDVLTGPFSLLPFFRAWFANQFVI